MKLGISLSAILLAGSVSVPAPKPAVGSDAEIIRRQSRELVDAITAGSAGVWDEYLDEAVRYVDESGAVMSKKEMVDGTRPLPDGVSGEIRVLDFDAAVLGDAAVDTYVADENESYHGHALHCQYRTTETWRRTSRGWRLIAAQVLALRTDPPPVALSAALRNEYVGRYALTPAISYEIRTQGDGLEGQQSGRPSETLRAEAPDVLFVPGKPRYRYVFLRDEGGAVVGFAQRREAWDLVWKRESRGRALREGTR